MSTPENEPTSPATGTVDFALAPTIRARLLGTGLAAIGTVVLVAVLLSSLVGLPTAFVTGLVVIAGLGVLTLGALVGPRHWVLRLDGHGYRVRGLRPGGARSARWTDVKDLQTSTLAGHRAVVLRLRDGRSTTLPVAALEGSASTLTQALSDHLDRGHGYRRLR